MNTVLPRDVERVAFGLFFERGMKVAGADEGRRVTTRPRTVDKSEMSLFYELEDYYARMSEMEWEADAARRL